MKNMTKKFATVMVAATAVTAIAPALVNAEEAVEYKVPVQMKHAHEDKDSMGNAALDHTAKVIEKDGKTEIYINVKGLSFMGLFGHLWGMNVYENGLGSAKSPVTVEKTFKDKDLEGKTREFPQVLKIVRDKTKEDKVYINVEVDAMDAISSGGASTYEKTVKGKGAQDAILMLDYSKAEKVTPDVKPEEKKDNKVRTRIAGVSRYATAAKISSTNYDKADSVILANAYKDADALAAAPLAASMSAPILLTKGDAIPAETMTEITRLGAKKVYIAGGEGSVSAGVADQLKKAGIEVIRISGDNKYQTAVKIAEMVRATGNKEEAILVNGTKTADALSVSAFATKMKAPVLLTGATSLNADVDASLKAWNLKKITVVGGVNSVAKSVEDAAKAEAKVRISGDNKYATSVAIAKHAYANPKSVMVANGVKTADALAAGAVTAKTMSPVVLVNGKAVAPELKTYLAGTEKISVVGGVDSIPDALMNLLGK
ncbi:MAG: cell wall-binding repeat-containing protein [Peptostreptococcus sp.]|uniref:cell wall-binding repeat-containing protein n=1 Tax=Peptostreptococcus sp. TaxID=1262 RepID=UPI001CB109C9|nr:cell wall-binding repeat-containing protein [Peptostreptococcus sp.]MBF1057266.1 cell wall-binding repeat-containing protein [Peptostreptococcus sp.]